MAGKAANSRVTMALLGQKLDTIETMLRKQCELQSTDHDRISALEGEDKRLHERIDRTNDRVTAFQAGQALLTVIASTLAGWLGARQ